MQVISSDVTPLPSAARNLSAINWTVQATPETSMPLLPTAPIVPETCVPWPALSSSVGVPLEDDEGDTVALMPCRSLRKPLVPGLGLVHRLATRSVCVRRMPESMMATITPGAPDWMDHAAGAPMSAPGVPPLWPVLFNDHCWPKDGSLGTVRA
jgi:hypothetical protein